MNIESMDIEHMVALEQRVAEHAAMADLTRLRIIDRLTLTDASASELGAALEVPSNLLAHHLNVLTRAGLVTRHRSEGDGRRSYLSLAKVGASRSQDLAARPRRMVFVCTANTARSHLAAALWRTASTVDAISAGTHPGNRINPGAVAAAKRHGMALPEVAPVDLAEVARVGDLVVTVCDRAHEEAGVDGWAHWSVPDPVADGSTKAFDRAFEQLSARVAALAARLASAS